MYLEPCCIDKTLPHLLKSQPFVCFQTSGDVLGITITATIAAMVSQSVVYIAQPQIDILALRKLYTWMCQGTIRGVVLVTQSDQTEMVSAEMGKHIDKVMYAYDKRLLDSQCAVTNFNRYALVQGPLLTEVDNTLCLYSAFFGAGDCSALHSAIEGVMPRLHINPAISSDNADVVRFVKLNF